MSEANRQSEIDHINSFPVVNSHYCRAKTNNKYVEAGLNIYNLTAQTSTKQGCCDIWTELTSGRADNDIASAAIAILNKVVEDHPTVTDIVCWSDSCVLQNRNSHILQAILEFLWKHAEINSILLKYPLVCHSCVQDVN